MAARTTQTVVEVILGAAVPVASVRITSEVLEAAVGSQVRATQDVIEAVLLPPAATVRATQETVEAVLQPALAAVRSTQEALEVVLTGAPPAAEGAFAVVADPRVRWLATVPVNEFTVRTRPVVVWDASAEDTLIRFTVHTAPQVIWNTGPGTATTQCVTADGVVPPPEEPPEDTGEENYVF